MQLRILDFDKEKYFKCDGREFEMTENLSFARYRKLQEISLEFGYSASFHDIFKNIRIAWDFLNDTKLGEAAVILHNIMYGVVSLENKYDAALRLCALFINEKGEDIAVYSEAIEQSKIDCWGKELDVTPFFHLASNLVTGWMPAYKVVSRSGLKKEKSKSTIG